MTAFASRRCLMAKPSEPPNKPTPTMVIFFQRTAGVSGFKFQVSSCKLRSGQVNKYLRGLTDSF